MKRLLVTASIHRAVPHQRASAALVSRTTGIRRPRLGKAPPGPGRIYFIGDIAKRRRPRSRIFCILGSASFDKKKDRGVELARSSGCSPRGTRRPRCHARRARHDIVYWCMRTTNYLVAGTSNHRVWCQPAAMNDRAPAMAWEARPVPPAHAACAIATEHGSANSLRTRYRRSLKLDLRR